jgi:hypothetical protein
LSAPTTHTGGCQCGAVRFTAHGDPVMVYACHCTICQKQSGSAFGMAVVFDRATFSLNGTAPAHFIRPGREGRQLRCYFCPSCGSRLYHQWFTAEGDAPFVNVKPGTLDDTSWLVPGCHVWTSSAQPWFRFAPDDVVFPEQPDIERMPRFKREAS